MLTRDEGRRNEAYQDSLGLWTIGIGHHDDSVCSGMVWSDDKVDQVFADDVAEKIAQCQTAFPWFDQLNEARQAVLIAMCFQMGMHRLSAFVNTLAAMERGDYSAAADGMRNSVWAHQTPVRVARMALQMERGVWV